MSKQLKNNDNILNLDQNYKSFLKELKDRLRTSQIKAALAVNKELIKFYWELGSDIIKYQKQYKWGEKFLEQLSHDLHQNSSGMQGFSVRNLQRMKQFFQFYPDVVITTQSVSQLPWGHITRLMQLVKDPIKREWYVHNAINNGWSRSVLEIQIESQLYERQAIPSNKITNYNEHLPAAQSDLANQLLKDPYNFDFLTISEDAHERAIEDVLITHIRDFLLELSQGFAFVGSQVPLTFEDQEFFIDLLFYHLNLRCFVVIELKATKFKPEHTGQLGFYLAAADDLLKKEHDNPTVGILLCKSKNKIIAEYALKNVKAPIGISEYQLSKALPKELKTSLPTIEEIEAELNEKIKK